MANWYITNTGRRLAIRRPIQGEEISLEIDLPQPIDPRDPQAVVAALKAALAALQEAVDTESPALFALQ